MVDSQKRRMLWLALAAIPARLFASSGSSHLAAGVSADLPPPPFVPVSEDDPLADAMGFRQDAARVDARYFPTRKLAAARTEFCGDCLLYRPLNESWGRCVVMIPDGVVNVIGWCGRWTSAGKS